MLPAMGGAPIDHLADVETVLEQMGERSGAETDTALCRLMSIGYQRT